jgi:hypothetical protein
MRPCQDASLCGVDRWSCDRCQLPRIRRILLVDFSIGTSVLQTNRAQPAIPKLRLKKQCWRKVDMVEVHTMKLLPCRESLTRECEAYRTSESHKSSCKLQAYTLVRPSPLDLSFKRSNQPWQYLVGVQWQAELSVWLSHFHLKIHTISE